MQDENFRGLRFGRRAQGSGKSAPKVHEHQRALQLSCPLLHIKDISEAKELIRLDLQRSFFNAELLTGVGYSFIRRIAIELPRAMLKL